MAASESAALMVDPGGTNKRRSPERWSEILGQLTTLFLIDAGRFTDAQIALFDAVFLQLVVPAGTPALGLLSDKLSGISAAPPDTIRRLALHDDISVAGPILRRSNHLTDRNLLEIAKLRGEGHSLEIASRQTVSTSLSDELVARGELSILSRLALNLGVKFSQDGCLRLVAKARQDRALAELVARRSDIPTALRRELAAQVTDHRTRILQAVPSSVQSKIQAAVATTAERVALPALTHADYSAATTKMVELSRKGRLNDRSVNGFAVQREYVDVVAAVSLLSGASVEVIAPLLHTADLDGLIVACKAARLNWSTATMILLHRPGSPTISDKEIEQAKAIFDSLSISVAQRTIRLW